ncbi:MAG TPA: methyltransferase domain-containing protein [Acidimicrobiales bacterium]|nr:methyltransferase domain-containing protein [Acidimicrobiales bacterium]
MLRVLPRVVPEAPGRPELAGGDHPMRKVTRQIAFERDGWTPERAGKVLELFDSLAPTWDERDGGGRGDALRLVLGDALDRGGPMPPGWCLEVGCGTGAATGQLAPRFAGVVGLDLSYEMLARASGAPSGRLQADGANLPVHSAAAAAVALVNAFLFPEEVDRVLGPAGAVIWVNTLGDRTPIHLPADDVLAALPGDWEGVASEAGWGTWAVLRRVGSAGLT